MRRRTWALVVAFGATPLACGLTHDVGGLASERDGRVTAGAGGSSGAAGAAASSSAGAGGTAGTSSAGTGGTAISCGAANESCCDGSCDQTNLKCVSGTCVTCGGEGQPCCDNPLCVDSALKCGADGVCHTCPSAGAQCGAQVTQVCVGIGDTSQCQPCGTFGQRCCNPGAGKSCPASNNLCCNGIGGEGCTLCTLGASNCTCKACCVRCANWAAGNFVKIDSSADTCPTDAQNYCVGKGGKAHGKWQSQCP